MKKIDIEIIFNDKFKDSFLNKSIILKKLVYKLLNLILYIDTINKIVDKLKDKKGVEFIDELFEELNFSYSVSNKDIKKIPSEGRIICVSNHPIGSLDGLALLKTISDIRQDVQIVVNDVLGEIENLQDLIIPFNIFQTSINKESIIAIGKALETEKAVIIFPAGEVSRLKLFSVKDSKWNNGALHFAKKYNAPVLPVFIEAKNSALFYIVSTMYKKFSTLLLVHELFNKKNKTITIKIGDQIPAKAFTSNVINIKIQSKLLKAHVYGLNKNSKGIFVTEKNIIHPVDRKSIKKELKQALLLGVTPDNKKIILTTKKESPQTLIEIARLRELTFRKVGEGTGKKLDLDIYDDYYNHLIVWDENELEIIGAYRIGNGKELLNLNGVDSFYTSTLFNFDESFVKSIMPKSIELGRSFVQRKYWNTNALYYLWLGIGAYLANFPEIKYLFGGVSISNNYPDFAKTMIVYFYSKWFKDYDNYSQSKNKYKISFASVNELINVFDGTTYSEDYRILKQMLKPYGLTVPILYKHYAELCEQEGIRFMDFGVDPDFENCIDGLILVDVTKIKEEKKERFINCFYNNERNSLNLTS